MSSDFDTAWTATAGPRASLLDYFGEAATHTARGADDSTAITIALVRDGVAYERNEAGEFTVDVLQGVMSQADVAAPLPGDTVTVGSTDYAIVEVASREGGMTDVVLQRVPQRHANRGTEYVIDRPGS